MGFKVYVVFFSFKFISPNVLHHSLTQIESIDLVSKTTAVVFCPSLT